MRTLREPSILLVLDGLYIAGMQRHCLGLLDVFRSLGYGATVLALEGGGRWADRFIAKATQLVIAQGPSFTWDDLQDAVGDTRFELVTAHLAVPIRWVAEQTPETLTRIAHFHSEPSEHEAITRDWLRSITDRFNRFLVPSDATRERFIAEISGDDTKRPDVDFRVLPNALTEFNRPGSAKKRAIGTKDSLLRLAVVSRVDHDKFSVPLFTQTISMLSRRFRSLGVRVAGDGDAMPELRESLARSSLEQHVSLLGFVDDVESLYRWSDVVFLPSKREGMPYVLLEAVAAQRPLVAPAIGALRDLVLPSRAFTFPAGDARSATKAILHATRARPEVRRSVTQSLSVPLLRFDQWIDAVKSAYAIT